LLGISDGAKGLIVPIEQVFPASLRRRCLIHRLRNVLAKTPVGMQAEIRDGHWAVFDTDGLKTKPGPTADCARPPSCAHVEQLLTREDTASNVE
jgi:putative transposase